MIVSIYKDALCMGLIGNFASHLEQAGEACDFIDIECEENAPKGIFPFYIPHDSGFLGNFCIQNDILVIPNNLKVQVEAEVCLECEVVYENNLVKEIKPKFFFAFNDASVRKSLNATKLSQKKNFSIACKAAGHLKFRLDDFKNNACSNFSIVSFVESNNKLIQIGENSPLESYNYFYNCLLDWSVNILNTQKNIGVLDNLYDLIKTSNYPKKLLLSVGATRYTQDGENLYLKNDDLIFVFVYNHNKYNLDSLQELTKTLKYSNSISQNLEDISIIAQRVRVI